MSSDRVIEMQHQIRENSSDLDNYLRDLKNWENEMKKKDQEIREAKLSPNSVRKNSDAKKDSVRSDNQIKESESCVSKRKKQALDMKDSGNDHFKKGNYTKAIEFYTLGMEEDIESAVFPANRAMAYMKIGEMVLAEKDCNNALALDPSYVKAYLRRGSVRVELKNLSAAENDFVKVLELEPKNKQAILELKKIKDMKRVNAATKPSCNLKYNSTSQAVPEKHDFKVSSSDSYENSAIINPVKKDLDKRSKKPLVTVKVKNVSSSADVVKKEKAILSALRKSEVTICNDVRSFSEDKPFIEDIEKTDQIISETNENIQEIQESKVASLPERKLKSRVTTVKFPPSLEQCVALSSVSLPSVPTRSYQFQADWKKLRDHPQLRYEYLKQFPPQQFPSLFQCSMESELFADILRVLAEHFVKNGDDVSTYLLFLCKIGRFQTLLMMISEEEMSYVEKLLDYINSSGDCSFEEKRAITRVYRP